MDTELKQRIKAHKDDIEKLSHLSPETEFHQAEISRFFLSHPGIIGISYSSAEVLMKEKNHVDAMKAIERVSEELRRRRDVNAPDYCFVRRCVSENQVRKILLSIKKEIDPKPVVEIPKVQGNNTRSKVISFRATDPEEGAINFLASKCGVPKSFLIDALITISNRYGIELKKHKA